MAPVIVEAGVDVLDISSGICCRYHFKDKEPGFFILIAEEIKKVVSVPVIGVGGITTAELANKYVSEERVDLVANRRALMRGPECGREGHEGPQVEGTSLRP